MTVSWRDSLSDSRCSGLLGLLKVVRLGRLVAMVPMAAGAKDREASRAVPATMSGR